MGSSQLNSFDEIAALYCYFYGVEKRCGHMIRSAAAGVKKKRDDKLYRQRADYVCPVR